MTDERIVLAKLLHRINNLKGEGLSHLEATAAAACENDLAVVISLVKTIPVPPTQKP